MTELSTPRDPARSGLRPLVRALLVSSALATLIGWTLSFSPDDAHAYGAFAVLTVAGLAARLVRVDGRGSRAQLALVFVGALVLLVDGSLAVWGAAIVGLGGLARGDRGARVLVSASTLVLAQSAAASVRVAVAPTMSDVLVGRVGDGPLATAPFGVTVALAVGVVLAVGWAGLRWITAWVDRRSRTDVWRAQVEARWLRDITLAASAVVTAVLWATDPTLVLLILVMSIAVLRSGTRDDEIRLPGRDVATGLAATHVLRAALTEELLRAEQFERPVSVLFVSLDGIDVIGQQRGSDAAAEVVRQVARVASETARDYDVVARLGESDLAVVLPEAPESGAIGLAERVRDRVRALRVDAGGAELRTSVSIGVASFPGDASTHHALLTEAELAAGYAAIEGGDRIATAGSLPTGFRQGPGGDRATVTTTPPDTEPLGPDRLVRATPEPLADARPRTDRLLAAVLVVTAGALGASVWVTPDAPAWGLTLLFAALAVGADGFATSIFGRANTSWAAVPLVALAVVADVGPVSVALAAIAAGALGGLIRGVRVRQAWFNTAVLILSALAAWSVAAPFAMLRGDGGLATAGVGVLAGFAFFAVDTWLVAAAVAISGRTSVFDVWRDDLAWLVPYQLGMGLLAGVLAHVQEVIGSVGSILLALPALGLHLAQRHFTDRTKSNVLRLRHLNEDLEESNQRVSRVNERLTAALAQVNSGYLETVASLAAAVEARDGASGGHVDRVERYARRLLEVVEPSLVEDDSLAWGFRLHDIGMVSIPDRVLQKPGALDTREWDLVRKHPEVGAEIVAAAPFLQGARDVILHHHEHWDGSGYPYGLAEAAIPMSARLFAVVDAYDAMTSDRPYRPKMSLEQAMQELVRSQGRQLDPEMVEAFLQIPLDDLETIRAQVDAARDAGRSFRAGSALVQMAQRYADHSRHRTSSP